MNYDPNLTNSGRMASQMVRLTFGLWEHRLTVDVKVRGNCKGFAVLEAAISNYYDDLPEMSDGMGSMLPGLTMKNPNGDTLECTDDEEHGEEWLKDMLIAAEIVSITEAK